MRYARCMSFTAPSCVGASAAFRTTLGTGREESRAMGVSRCGIGCSSRILLLAVALMSLVKNSFHPSLPSRLRRYSAPASTYTSSCSLPVCVRVVLHECRFAPRCPHDSAIAAWRAVGWSREAAREAGKEGEEGIQNLWKRHGKILSRCDAMRCEVRCAGCVGYTRLWGPTLRSHVPGESNIAAERHNIVDLVKGCKS
jgi:hypothetical protein